MNIDNLCLSGGAIGADYAWAKSARAHGHQVVHWSFSGHKAADKQDVQILSTDLLKAVDPYLKIANIGVKRRYPTNSEHINNLLRRNYYQIIHTDSVYAISKLVGDGSELAVAGGTNWAMQLYIDRCRRENIDPVMYLFDMTTENWFTWTNGIWDIVLELPPPTGVYTGIGSRDITEAGLNAIKNAFG